jgi:hypothetical protein
MNIQIKCLKTPVLDHGNITLNPAYCFVIKNKVALSYEINIKEHYKESSNYWKICYSMNQVR